MKAVKIKFDGFNKYKQTAFNQEAQVILGLLQKHYKVELSDEPDYIFYDVNGAEYYKYDGIRIFVTREAICPDFNMADYGIGFEYLEYADRYFRYPNYGFYPGLAAKMAEKHKNISDDLADRPFCSFVYSNAKAAPVRGKLFRNLSQYKRVDSGGEYLNNMPDGKMVENKIEFESGHKFSVACENARYPGYHTEKLLESFAAKTVPIYWGDPLVEKVFNKRAFVDVNDYASLEEACAAVRELDKDRGKYLAMLKEPALNVPVEDGEKYEQEMLEGLERYLVHIFDPPLKEAYRRNRGYWGAHYEHTIRMEKRVVERYSRVKEALFGWYLRGRGD